MGRAEILALAVGGADEVFLVLRKVGSAALIHFAAALCAIQKPGEHTHFTHLGRTATRLANVLNNQEHTFLDDRRLGVLEDHPILRVIPDFLLALVGLLCSLEVYGMPQIVYALQNVGNCFICPFVRVCCRLVAGRQIFRTAIGGWIQDLLLFEPFSNLRRSLAGRAQGEYLLYDGCGFFIDDPFLFVLRAFHIPIGRNGRQMLAGLAFALACSTNLFRGIASIHFVEHIMDRGKLTFAACAVHTVIDGNEMNAKLRENNICIHSNLEIIAPESLSGIVLSIHLIVLSSLIWRIRDCFSPIPFMRQDTRQVFILADTSFFEYTIFPSQKHIGSLPDSLKLFSRLSVFDFMKSPRHFICVDT